VNCPQNICSFYFNILTLKTSPHQENETGTYLPVVSHGCFSPPPCFQMVLNWTLFKSFVENLEIKGLWIWKLGSKPDKRLHDFKEN
jgi:hypothetical protein